VLEIGTGCGWIATTLACKRPDLILHAADIDPAALSLARSNARIHGASIQFHESYFADDVVMTAPDFTVAVLPNGGDATDYTWRELEERRQMPPVAIFDPIGPLAAHRGLIASIARRSWNCEAFMERLSDQAEGDRSAKRYQYSLGVRVHGRLLLFEIAVWKVSLARPRSLRAKPGYKCICSSSRTRTVGGENIVSETVLVALCYR
jgi:hypothetical protein